MLGLFSTVSTYMKKAGVFPPPTAVQKRPPGFDHPFFALFTPHFCSPIQRTRKKLVYICSNRMFADLSPVSYVCKQPLRDILIEALKHSQSRMVNNTCKTTWLINSFDQQDCIFIIAPSRAMINQGPVPIQSPQ